ncbi:MAG TPA: signal peptide peptidase SppA, partial [Xanthobacteraceae bacterium]|nr:signal peptide peptidase SppA [Xanthobacteraceae bacterium]
MSHDADSIVDRRRLRRKLTFWRVLAVVAVVAVIGGLAAIYSGEKFTSTASAHVARVNIGGLIRNDRDRLKMFDEISKSGAKAVILSIDSPGGTVAGAEALYHAIRRLAEKKPVVAVVDGIGASGAYIVALASDRIFAPRNALIGSVGVIFQYPNFGEALKHLGISVEEIKSTPLKAAPNGYSPTSPEARAAIMSLVEDSYGWFKGLVRERRSLDDAELRAAADGRVFTAHQALPMHLIDQIGDEKAARAWLAKNKGISKDLPLRDWEVKKISTSFRWLSAFSWAAKELGLSTLASLLASDAVANFGATPQLDGLLALWQPP